jgi:Bacterial Ig domain/Secretion system C-terminal sorting domain
MSPSIYNGTLQWDATASSVITNSVNVRFNSCLPKCSRLAVQWTHPIHNQVFTNLNPIAFAANAAADGSVTSVSFWVNNALIGTDNSSPYTMNWTPPAFADYTLKAIVTDNLGKTFSDSIVITVQNGARTTVVVPIAQSSDDAEQTLSSGSVSLTSTDLELANEGGTTPQEVGMRFNPVNIPRNATITNAYIQFTTDETDANPVALTIYGEDKGNPLTFTSTTNNVSNRVKTAISVPWSPAAWTTIGEAGTAQRTPNLNTIIQKMVNRADWTPNNALVFLVNGASKRTAASYDYSAATAPVLHVTYTTYPTSVVSTEVQPLNFVVFPNPFSTDVHFRFELPQSAPIQMNIFNAVGQRVTTFEDKTFSAGQQEIHWTPTVSIPNGIYFLVLSDGKQRVMRKFVKH